MRVLIFSQHFTPEITAARARLHAFATGLAARGHEVQVICEVPNHPEGVIRPGYRRRVVVRKRVDGVDVRYVWVRTSPKKTGLTRALLYGSYAAMATVVGSASARPDVVLASSPPLPVAAAGAIVAARHRVPWIFDVRDLWPEMAVTLGGLTNPRLIRLAERLERRLYSSAAAIVTVNEAFRTEIGGRVADPEKIVLVPNGTTRSWLDTGELEVTREDVGLPEGQFVWTYAGNLGLSQGLESAIDAAGLLGEGYRLVILGQGPMRARLRQRAALLPDGRVEFHDPVEAHLAARVMRASDALLVPLDPRLGQEKVVPSKLFDCCATSRPVILAAHGESRRLAEAAGAVLAVPPGDPQALAEAVRKLQGDQPLRSALGRRGREFASRYLREDQAQQLAALVESVGRPS